MRFKTTYFLLILFISLITFGCGGGETMEKNGNTNTAVSNTTATDQLATTKTPEVGTTNEAPTFTPIVRAYCEAIIKKDEAALRKVHSQDTLKGYEADMKSDNVSTLVEFLGNLDRITDIEKCGARNEKIEGDIGVAEIRNENMPNGVKIEFLKENGEWKITNKSPDFNKVKDSATNSAK